MSRSKTETQELEEKIIENPVETVKPVINTVTTQSVSNTKKSKKMGVEIYLQNNPQPFEIATLLRAKYKMAVMTLEEWNEALAKLLAKKVIS